jgi:hypothetical protein
MNEKEEDILKRAAFKTGETSERVEFSTVPGLRGKPDASLFELKFLSSDGKGPKFSGRISAFPE